MDPKSFGTNFVRLGDRFGIFFMLVIIGTIELVSKFMFMEVGSGQQGETCPCGKDSKTYSEEN
jgi:hypothetical protein